MVSSSGLTHIYVHKFVSHILEAILCNSVCHLHKQVLTREWSRVGGMAKVWQRCAWGELNSPDAVVRIINAINVAGKPLPHQPTHFGQEEQRQRGTKASRDHAILPRLLTSLLTHLVEWEPNHYPVPRSHAGGEAPQQRTRTVSTSLVFDLLVNQVTTAKNVGWARRRGLLLGNVNGRFELVPAVRHGHLTAWDQQWDQASHEQRPSQAAGES